MKSPEPADATKPGIAKRGEETVRSFGFGRDHSRLLGLLASGCALTTLVCLAVNVMTAPGADLPAIAAVVAASGSGLLAAAVLAGRSRWGYGLNVAGIALMLLGIAAGVLVPDGLAAAAILPLGGAVLTLPQERGKRLAVMFLLAYAAGMSGVAAAYALGGMAGVVGGGNVARSLAEEGVMLGFIYGVVWWIGDRWWAATATAEHALASQRRLLEVNERLLSTLDPEGVLSLIADSLKSVVAYDNLTIYRVDRAAGLMRPVVARDRFAKLIMGTSLPLDVGVTGWVIAHGQAQCVNDSANDPRVTIIPGTPDEPETLIVVPLFVHGEVAGTLNVGRMGRAEAQFNAAEFELVRLFAGQASIALQNAETHRAVWDRAETDALTGLYNRGAFDERLEALVANPAAQPCSLIMVDLDGLKDFNDHHGHPAGDVVLQAVGRAISSAVRESDRAFRYGGDEFAVLLPRTELHRAVQVAERIRKAVASLQAGTPTASAGVACYAIDEDTTASLVTAADRALYHAKASGGNRTEIFAGSNAA